MLSLACHPSWELPSKNRKICNLRLVKERSVPKRSVTMMSHRVILNPTDRKTVLRWLVVTSNPNFADYVERVQQNLAVLSLTNEAAKRYLMESLPLARYNPRYISFEILFNDPVPNETTPEGSEADTHDPSPSQKYPVKRKFDPHVSDNLFRDTDLVTCWQDMKRFYSNAQELKLNLDEVKWEVPDHVKNDPYLAPKTQQGIAKLHEEILELDDIHTDLKDQPESDIRELDRLYEKLIQQHPSLKGDEKVTGETGQEETEGAFKAWNQLLAQYPDPSVLHSDLTADKAKQLTQLVRMKELFGYLLQRYQVQYIPTNMGSTALVYEAWKQGKLVPLGNPFGANDEEKRRFEQLLSALFINATGKEYKPLLRQMAENLGLDGVREIGKDTLSNRKKWVGTPAGWEWFTCVESSLVHKLDLAKPATNYRYLIYYPLLIDDYWFAGVAFIYSDLNVDPSEGSIPEVFNRQKYAKIYNTIKSVSDTLKLALREESLKQAKKKLEDGMSVDDVFREVVRDYFVCFNVRREGEENDSHLRPTAEIYSGHGIRLFGPAWITDLPDKLALIRNEIEGYDASVRYVKGLYALVQDLAEDLKKEQEKGIDLGLDRKAEEFSHQVAGLMQVVLRDPKVQTLRLSTRASLWHIDILIQVWGTTNLDPKKSITENDFPTWKEYSIPKIIDKLIDLSLNHALGRATSRSSNSLNEDLDEGVQSQAFQIRGVENPPSEFRHRLGLIVPTSVWPTWTVSRGFTLCFHHALWQAAYHGFRALCSKQRPLAGTDSYLQIEITDNQVHILNSAIPAPEMDNSRSRDAMFFADVNRRLEGFFYIETPSPRDDGQSWITIITRQYED